MRMYDVISKKRDGGELSKEEVHFVVDGYTNNKIPNYQMSALLMAIYLKGMDVEETINLTMEMAQSGDMLDLKEINGVVVDKHSTGGVGDKTTLLLAPMVAACGVPIAKISGRGLGHTGGTIDKLESIDGFCTSISEQEFVRNVNEYKIAIAGQTANLAPADKKIYALRDVTATVASIPLIASSIMSKKIASGANCIVLDVKVGDGAFMKNQDEAEKLAKLMVDIGNGVGRKTVALITDMSQPLGHAVGNALEVIEVIDTLNGKVDEEILELCMVLGKQMLMLSGEFKDEKLAEDKLKQVIQDGTAKDKFKQLIENQGGMSECVSDKTVFKQAKYIVPIISEKTGWVESIRCEEIGKACLILGAGRETKDSVIDLSVGIILNKKVGESVQQGETLAVIHANDQNKVDEVYKRIVDNYVISNKRTSKPSLIKKIIY